MGDGSPAAAAGDLKVRLGLQSLVLWSHRTLSAPRRSADVSAGGHGSWGSGGDGKSDLRTCGAPPRPEGPGARLPASAGAAAHPPTNLTRGSRPVRVTRGSVLPVSQAEPVAAADPARARSLRWQSRCGAPGR